jgi:hypothetical protein
LKHGTLLAVKYMMRKLLQDPTVLGTFLAISFF